MTHNLDANAAGVLLSGMGANSAKGRLKSQQHGARTLGQDEQSSVIWGMPGAAGHVVPLDKVAQLASRLVRM